MLYINRLNYCLKLFIFFFLFYGLWNALIIGGSWDEPFHHINGIHRLRYLISFGEYQNYNYLNNRFYPGLFDTLSGLFSFIINKFYPDFLKENFFNIKHLLNFIFASLSILGLYNFIKIFTKNKSLALVSCLLTLCNPFFFGHMGINPKDTIIFFSLIWFLYFFYKYILNKKDFKNLILFSFFLGFGCGIRISFFAIIFPILIFGFYFYMNKFKLNFLSTLRLKIIDITLCMVIVSFLTFLTWPHIQQGNFGLFIETLKNSITWSAGPRLVIINGIFYETSNVSKIYFLSFLMHKMPIYQSLLFFLAIYLFSFKKDFFIKQVNQIKQYFSLNLIIILFSVFLTIIFSVKIYDGIRLFLFLIPFFCSIAALSVIYLIYNLKKNYFNYILISVFIFFTVLSLNRFFIFSPYQYSYLNYTFFDLSLASNKYENDYWNTSWKELIKNVPDIINGKKISNYKFATCGGDKNVALHYLSKKFKKINFTKPIDADFIIMTNRASFNKNDKRSCFDIYKGKDLFYVKRGNLILSKFTMLKNMN